MLARNYDPLIGRFMQVDPLAMDYPAITPYSYVLNNPLGLIDPDGKQPRPHIHLALILKRPSKAFYPIMILHF